MAADDAAPVRLELAMRTAGSINAVNAYGFQIGARGYGEKRMQGNATVCRAGAMSRFVSTAWCAFALRPGQLSTLV